MSDHSRTYSREQLEAVLGLPTAAVNSRNVDDGSPWLLMSRSKETVLYEEPLSGSMYWLVWRCQITAENDDVCWAAGTPRDDAWQLVKVCSIHVPQFRGSEPLAVIESGVDRRSWLNEYWNALEVLDGLTRRVDDEIATYGGYEVSCEVSIPPVGPSDRDQDVRVAFSIRLLSENRTDTRVVYSMVNCTPRFAAHNTIHHLLADTIADIWLIGKPEPIIVYPDPSDQPHFGTTSSGEAIMFGRDDITRIFKSRQH